MIRTSALILSFLLWAVAAHGAESFMISDIRVEGLQRISEGTVYSYLPLNRGDRLTPSATRSAIRELYRTGFFSNIEFGRDGDILVITVLERPAIVLARRVPLRNAGSDGAPLPVRQPSA